jgi:hypothetical protein
MTMKGLLYRVHVCDVVRLLREVPGWDKTKAGKKLLAITRRKKRH